MNHMSNEPTDIVTRLRIRWDAMGDMANQQRAEAAVQISTMMDELEAWRQAMQKADRDIAQLRNALEIEKDAVDHLHTDRNNLRLEVERLRADRNNLRLEIDRMVDKLTAQRDAARRERDEARREVCESDTGTHGGALLEADRRGWDCFKEKP